jgi:oxygen-independent coproporphyrinogen-3 oxidase
MKFGIYVHIPYCLQRCTYCDFATYERSQILPSEQYIQLLKEEIRQKHLAFPKQELTTLYFGGGTPSLLPSEQILAVIQELANNGFSVGPATEVTIEINPATIDTRKLDHYLEMGINRFSVGAQTFDDPLLKSVHREHNAKQTRETLDLLSERKVNFSFDLLFALPGQTLEILRKDLEEVVRLKPAHVSPYCLTVPEGHVLSKGRPLEDTQLEMFEMIRETLVENGYHRYEISNFSLPGFESRHNSLYLDDEAYWGLGLSAHSYMPNVGPYGTRFWNPNAIGAYQKLIESRSEPVSTPQGNLNPENFEELEAHQALTDFCHTSLRRERGLVLEQLRHKFGPAGLRLVTGPLADLVQRGWLQIPRPGSFALTEEGVLVSNQVFSALAFLKPEWSRAERL